MNEMVGEERLKRRQTISVLELSRCNQGEAERRVLGMNDEEYRARVSRSIGSAMNPELNKKVFFCRICKHQSKTKGAIFVHVEALHLNVKRYPCNFCSERFKTDCHRRVHSVRKHGEAMMKAKVLGEDFFSH